MDSATIRSLARQNRALTIDVIAMLVLVVVSVVGLLVDPRLLGGQPIWAKPLKFSVSIALYGATLAWMIPMITRPGPRRWAGRMGVVAAVTSGIEMVIIVGQVARGRASHFNQATDLDTVLWRTMGASIVVLWLATVVIAILLVRERTLAPALGRAVRLGLGVAVLGMAVAFLMTTPTAAQLATPDMPVAGGHAVGVPDGGPGLPLVGWSTTGGDLRIAHFLGLHALQGLPLLAFALLALAARVPALRDERVRARLIGVGGAAWTALVALLTWQALRAQPLIAPDGLTLAVLGAVVVATAGGVAWALRRPTSAPVASRVLEPR